VVEHEFGDLLQTPGHRAVSLRDRAAQFVVAHRSGSFVHCFLRLDRHLAQIFHFTGQHRTFILVTATRN
jgi:hypothetical protein